MKLNLQENNKFIVLFILLMNFVVGFFSIQLTPIGLDEPFSIFHAQMDISEIISGLKGGNNPPLFEIILHYWIQIFGIDPISVRFPSLIFSTLTLLFTFKIAKRISTTQNALLATLLMSLSNYFIYFSHEARAYSLFALLSVIAFYLILKISSSKGNNIIDFVTLGIVFALIMYNHYFGVFVFMLQSAFFLFINKNDKSTIQKYLILGASVLLLYSPYLLEFYSRFMDSSQNGTWVKATENLGNLHDMLFWFSNKNKLMFALIMMILYGAAFKLFSQFELNSTLKIILKYFITPLFFLISISIFFSVPVIWRLTEIGFVTFAFVAVITIVFAYVAFIHEAKNRYITLLVGSFLIPLLLFFSVSFVVPIWIDRYLIFILPFFYICLSIAISFVAKGKYYYSLAIVVCIGMLYSFDIETSDHDDVDQVVEYVKENSSEETIIVLKPRHFDLAFMYYYDRNLFSDYQFFPQTIRKNRVYAIYGLPGLNEVKKHNAKHIIYLDAHSNFSNPNNEVYKKLNETYTLESEKMFFNNINVMEFITSN